MTSTLDEENIIDLIWKKIGTSKKRDPFDDDAVWVANEPMNLIVAKSDMLVASTDAPPQMTAAQFARKSIVSCVSDFAAKGVKPSFCLVSLGMPRAGTNRQNVNRLADGFASAQREYGLRILGGDVNETSGETVIDCTTLGFSNEVIPRDGARPGQLVGVSSTFGHQSAGLLILLGRVHAKDSSFKKLAVDSVLNPKARLALGIKASRYLSSCIDSSDGLAISLHHLARSGKVKLELDEIPVTPGVNEFSRENKLQPSDLALFGGEEFELVCTFDSRHKAALTKLGVRTIGRVVQLSGNERPSIFYHGKQIRRRGWIHFRS